MCYFNAPPATETYTLSLHDALPISVARLYGLEFLPVRAERYDFAIPADRWDRPAVAGFRGLLDEPEVRERLAGLGFPQIGRAHVCSSHVEISYAVFCLKKKKEYIN